MLFVAGDIHPHPGPSYSTSDSSSSISDTHYPELNASTLANHFSFIHYNVQSILNKIDLLQSELSDFDVLAFTETWLHDGITNDDIHIPSYNIVRKDRVGDSHGGVIIYIKDNINFKRRTDLEIDGLECIWIELILGSKHVLFSVFYRPPNSITLYNDMIENSIAIACDTGNRNIIITGDFNYNTQDPRSFKKIDSICKQFNLTQIIKEHTHYTENNASVLDLIFVSSVETVFLSGVSEPFLDQQQRYHLPVYGIFKFNVQKIKSFKRKIWKYDQANYDQLRSKIVSTDWDKIYNDNIDTYATSFANKISEIASVSIPNKIINVNPNDIPWINSSIKKKIRKRKRCYKKAKSNNTEQDWEKFKKIRNEVITMLRQSKSKYFEDMSSKLKNNSSNLNSKDWWKTLKSFISKSNKQSIPPLCDPVTNTYASNNFENASILNNYFKSQSTNDEIDKILPDPNIPTSVLDSITINPSEVEEVLKLLHVDKAPGPDGISNRILREIATEISPHLCKLYNSSLKNKVVPYCWKEAHVSAIFKKGDASNPCNYRPISLLNTLEKAFERIIFKYVFNYLKDTNFFTPFQSGFVPGDSTVNQLTYLYDTFCKALDNGLEVRAVFFDISKAFDKVWHRGLLYKLKNSGITGDLHSWFENYLSNRKQRIVLPGTMSDWCDIKAGVPQGSILGPLLFLIFINDIVSELRCNVRLFADDTSLYIIVTDHDEAASLLKSDIDIISLWSEMWLVKFNPSKSESLLFSRKHHNQQPPSLYMSHELIKEVSSHKHLGLVFSNDCTWHEHIQNIVSKAWKRINVMRKLKYNLDRKSLEIIYLSFIRPLLEYADIVWSNCSQADKSLLDKIQNEAARIVCGSTKLVSIHDLQAEVGWDSLEVRRNEHKLILFYKMFSQTSPNYLSDLLTPTVADVSRYELRNSNNLQTVNARTSLYYNSFIPSATRVWNDLPLDIRSVPTINAFKHQLRKNKKPIPSFYYYGSRKGQILHSRLRTKCSSLNHHLHLKNIIETSACGCGETETTFHYFFECPFYSDARAIMLQNLQKLDCRVTLNSLLFGDNKLSINKNESIFSEVHEYIHKTKRFS